MSFMESWSNIIEPLSLIILAMSEKDYLALVRSLKCSASLILLVKKQV